ncbi:hypothetical protein GYMLUDRAFT_52464 [Collybiopsis luxurians FD-317 M1]|nr:hypothetical protein GYMLUDRAFT_52464 [Collybiopsis luxurians FD-317 M1]
MSDQPPPPKPKPGSLRDRIAAFEKAAPSNAPPPAPRPKPGTVAWKPKPATPPDSPGATGDVSSSQPKKIGGGMSASDARDSIGKGGSLKERMAALQGKGAFGGPPPPVAPKPAIEKPKWKPPPVVPPSDESEGKEVPTEKLDISTSPPVKSPGEELNQSLSENEVSDAGPRPEAEEEEKEADPEEEERQRRATLAARMARLGGARVGMGPPVFGGPAYKKPQPKPEEVSNESVSESVKSEESSLKSPVALEMEPGSLKSDEEVKKDYFQPERKSSNASSLLSPESSSSATTSPRVPSSMPVPAGPRRAGPPRRKAKSPAPPPVEERETGVDSSTAQPPFIGDKEPEIGQVSFSADPEPQSVEAHSVLDQPITTGPLVDDVLPEPSITEEPAAVIPAEETTIPISTTSVQDSQSLEASLEVSQHPVKNTEAVFDDTEEDEDARRKRVAERLAKSGGVNPFAMPPPRRKPTLPVEAQEEISPLTSPSRSPVSERRTSVRKVSSDSIPSSPPPPPARRSSQMSITTPAKKPSIDSVASKDINSQDALNNWLCQFLFLDDITSPMPVGISEEPERSLEEADIADQKVPEEDIQPEAADYQSEENPISHELEDLQPVQIPAPPPRAVSHVDDPAPVIPSPPADSEPEDVAEEEYVPPPPPRRSMLPPARMVPPPVEAEGEPERSFSPIEMSPELPRRLPPRPVVDDDGEMSDAPLPHPHRRSVPTPPGSADEADEARTSDDEAPPIPTSSPVRYIPPPKEHTSRLAEEMKLEEEVSQDNDEIEEILPTPPRRTQSPQHDLSIAEEPLFVPPPPPKSPFTPSTVQRKSSVQDNNTRASSGSEQSPLSTLTMPAETVQSRGGNEILDEEEGDPIDPSFYSPSRGVSAIPPSSAPAAPEPPVESEPEPDSVEDAEQTRRRTIAERMAKLGGIKFGAAPIPIPRPPPARRQESEEGKEGDQGDESHVEDEPQLTEEEEERARKERIAAKMASMGGMRIGMQPYGMFAGGAPPPPPPSRPPPTSAESITSSAASVPHPIPRHAAPPPPQPQDIDSEHESLSTSDEGVRVEAEESEMEEVNYEDAQEEEEEEDAGPPPPVPTREGRSQHVPAFPGRPPVPSALPARRPSVQSSISPKSDSTASIPARKSSASQPIPPSASDYVMVEGSDDDFTPPPPPPPRASRPPPPRTAPAPPPAPGVPPSESISSQWEMPSIPSVDFGASTDLSLSWTDDISTLTSSAQVPPESSQPVRKPADQVMNAEDLVAVWGRVGVQVCEVATTLHENSKKSLIGDGTYHGFVEATLKEVPNAAPISGQEYGYLVYMQSGSSVQKRLSDIMPGDIVWMHEAKLKGHKGLQTYSQNVGSGEPLVGIVGEFESKKFKIRVFQANQHVGQQTVESVSYRLEDLKSGLVKIFRVLEA